MADSSDLWHWSSDAYRTLDPRNEGSINVSFAFDPWALTFFLPHLRPGHYALPAAQRFSFLGYLNFGEADSLRYLLWEDGNIKEEDIRNLDEAGFLLIETVALYYRREACPRSRGDNIESWGRRQLARDIMGLTTLLHSYTDNAGGREFTPMPAGFYIVQYCMRSPLLLEILMDGAGTAITHENVFFGAYHIRDGPANLHYATGLKI